MPAAVDEGYDHSTLPQEAGVRAPIRDILHYANRAHTYFSNC